MRKVMKITDCQERDAFKHISCNLLQSIEPSVISKKGSRPERKNRWGNVILFTAWVLIFLSLFL